MLKLLMLEHSEHTKFKKTRVLDAEIARTWEFGAYKLKISRDSICPSRFELTPVNVGVSKGNIINTQSSERTEIEVSVINVSDVSP